jgi:hypothetical protein
VVSTESHGKDERRAWKSYAQHRIASVTLIREAYDDHQGWYPNLNRVMDT